MDKPFKPHMIARSRPLAYMMMEVMKYIDNLIAWGDQLFRQDTIESIDKAAQLYLFASHILGSRPQIVPSRKKKDPKTYADLKEKLDAFSNVDIKLKIIFQCSSDNLSAQKQTSKGNILGIGKALYFCVPNNDQLLRYWDTVEDRLFKIRRCMNIEGVERTLALFEPPIDPGIIARKTSPTDTQTSKVEKKSESVKTIKPAKKAKKTKKVKKSKKTKKTKQESQQ